jgi:uncharacterized cofD-like protein
MQELDTQGVSPARGGDRAWPGVFAPRSSAPTPPPLARLRVVAIGGGTGLPIVLEGLKRALFEVGRDPGLSDLERLTAIVTVADNGGSSGRLRRAYRLPAPGDLRRCLLALSEGDTRLKSLFGFRFHGDGDVAGHSLGNLILTALSLAEGDVLKAVQRASSLLAVRGRVLPSTLADVGLVADLNEGGRVRGETAIARHGPRIRRLFLEPEDAPPAPEARESLRRANLVVIGPGSLYTSLLAPLLVPGLVDAIVESGARVALVMNAMTEPGESDGLTAAQHVSVLRRHGPRLPIHDVLLNGSPIPEGVLARYAATGAVPVDHDLAALEALGCRGLIRGLLDPGPKVRHDPRALATALLEAACGDAARRAAASGAADGAY